MAQITTLKDNNNQTIYPVTGFGAVIDADGNDLEERFQQTDTSINQAKLQLLGDIWNSRCRFDDSIIFGKYDPDNAPDSEHPFMANELWFTAAEAIDVLTASHPKYCANSLSFGHTYPNVKTILPTRTYGNGGEYVFRYCSELVNISLFDGYCKSADGPARVYACDFYFCTGLKRVLNPISPLKNISGSSFAQCNKLHELKFCLNQYSNCTSIDLSGVPMWSLESAQYTVANKTIGETVTIMVHTDVYAKLTGDTSNEAAAALSEEELEAWGEVLTSAVAKNISFATT